MIVIGLTGGIGSGKSAVAEHFSSLGAPIVDTDIIAHALTAPGGAGIAPLCAAFGSGILTRTGALDRPAMRRLVFSDPAARARLEAILHPLVRAEAGHELRHLAAADSHPYAMLVVPLLIEAGENYRECIHRIAVVDCPEEMQIARVMARNGLTRAEVEAILAAQASRAIRRAKADDLIDNNADLAQLHTRVAELAHLYCTLGTNAPNRPAV